MWKKLYHGHQRHLAWLQGITQSTWGLLASAEKKVSQKQPSAPQRSIKLGKLWVGECTALSPQPGVTFTLSSLEAGKFKCSHSSMPSFRGEKKGRKWCPGTSRSISRHRGKNSRNLGLRAHKEVQVTGQRKNTKTFLEKVLSSYVILLCFEEVWIILKSSRGYWEKKACRHQTIWLYLLPQLSKVSRQADSSRLYSPRVKAKRRHWNLISNQ